MLPPKALLLAVFAAITASPVFATDILLDQFSDGNRTAQIPALGSPPYNTVPWTASNPALVTVENGALKLSPYFSGSSCWTWAYVTPSGSPINLNVGDQLKLTFKYTYDSNFSGVVNFFRAGLFFTGTAPRQFTDGGAFTPPTLRGYTVQTDTQTSRATGSAIYAENNANLAGAAFSISGGGTYAKVGTDFDSVDSGSTSHIGQMTLTRNASSITIAVDLNTTGTGAKSTSTDTTLNQTSFDTIAFFHQSVGSNTHWVYLDDIHLEYLPAITTSVIVDEHFADGTRDTQTPALGTPPYSSLPWHVSHADLTSTSSALGMSQLLGASGQAARQAWAYFTPQGSPVSLAPGETLQLSFDYQYTDDVPSKAGMLRFGLFNGGTSARALSDGTSAAPMKLGQDGLAGYEFEVDSQANTAKGVTAKREINSGTDNLVFFGTTTVLQPQYTSLDAGTVKRSAVMTIKNHGWKTDLTLNLDTSGSSGVMVIADTSTDHLTSFDLAAFNNTSSLATAVSFSNIVVKRVTGTATPEPYPTYGGEGGQVFMVTSLADSGTGTLRDALTQSMPRTIQFAVGGDIILQSPIFIRTPYVTVDGASAPSPGITVLGDRLNFKTHDVIMRHLRIRSGDKIQSTSSTGAGWVQNPDDHTTDQRDSLQYDGNDAGTTPGHNYLVENCSISWAVDENMEIYGPNTHDVVVRNCIFSEGLQFSIHWKTYESRDANGQPHLSHSAGLIAGPMTSNIVIDGNLFAHNSFRNPAVSAGTHAVIANNLIYDPGFAGLIIYPDDAFPSGTVLSVVSNALIKGPSTTSSTRLSSFYSTGINLGSQLYFSNNTSTGIIAFDTSEIPANYSGTTPFVATPPEPALLSRVNPLNPADVQEAVLSNAGARPWERDAVDSRIISDVQNSTGSIINTPPDPRVSYLSNP